MSGLREIVQNDEMKILLPYAHKAANLCEKLENSYERILRSSSDGRTHGRTDESEFIGPKSASRGTKKMCIFYISIVFVNHAILVILFIYK